MLGAGQGQTRGRFLVSFQVVTARSGALGVLEAENLYDIPILQALFLSRKLMPLMAGECRSLSGSLGAISCARNVPMLDLVMLAIAAAFFIVSVSYAYACDRL